MFQCVKNSRHLPLATVNMVKDYPEMTDWVHSMHYKAPFYISSNNYTKIAVDRVQAADQRLYNILLLSTGMFLFEKHALLNILKVLLYSDISYPVDLACNHTLSVRSVETVSNLLFQQILGKSIKCWRLGPNLSSSLRRSSPASQTYNQ